MHPCISTKQLLTGSVSVFLLNDVCSHGTVGSRLGVNLVRRYETDKMDACNCSIKRQVKCFLFDFVWQSSPIV